MQLSSNKIIVLKLRAYTHHFLSSTVAIGNKEIPCKITIMIMQGHMYMASVAMLSGHRTFAVVFLSLVIVEARDLGY